MGSAMASKKEPISIRQDRLDLDEIKTLLETLEKHEVTEFKLEREDEKLWLKRGTDNSANNAQANQGPYPQYPYPPMFQAPAYAPQQNVSPAVAPQSVGGAPNISVVPSSPLDSKSYKEVRSPMVGTFYRRPAVDAEAYVNVGDSVKKGDVLCIVEAMKLMNEIESEVSGKIVEICLEDGQMVEYGEVIFKIEQK
jgi:acetyl-CoA carboxylase biotin carboxyl carrier protein